MLPLKTINTNFINFESEKFSAKGGRHNRVSTVLKKMVEELLKTSEKLPGANSDEHNLRNPLPIFKTNFWENR